MTHEDNQDRRFRGRKGIGPLGEYIPEGEGRFFEAQDSIQAIHLFRSSDLLQTSEKLRSVQRWWNWSPSPRPRRPDAGYRDKERAVRNVSMHSVNKVSGVCLSVELQSNRKTTRLP